MFASKDLFFTQPSGYNISRSVRLRSSASAYFNRTPAGAGSTTTWTWSGWVKRGSLSNSADFLFAIDNSNRLSFSNSSNENTIAFENYNGAGADYYIITTAVYRDPSAWYHIVAVWDSNNATSTDRMRLYVNGIRVTAFSSGNSIPSGAASKINTAVAHNIGRSPSSNYPLDGYLTEINFIDGQALTPSSFGQTNPVTGVWQPIKYAGTYGTNGFYLNFSDNSAATAAAIGKDYSGNGNNWTPNNISVTSGVTYDSMIDVPTPYADGSTNRGNYCVLNPLNTYAVTPINGNLTASGSNAGFRGTMAIPSSGKWYWETVVTTFATQAKYVGIGQNNSIGTGVRYESDNGQKVVDGTNSSYGATWAVNDVIGIAVDAGAGTVTFYKNNVSQGSISYTFLTTDAYVPVMTSGGTTGSDVIQANFGQRPFTYTPPSGYNALNTQNLPAATIVNGSTYFDVIAYQGDSVNGRNVTGLSFTPDFVWIKNRGSTYSHMLNNVIQGGNAFLQSNTTSAEITNSIHGYLSAFVSGGFTATAGATSIYNINSSAYSYVAWNWKAGGTAVSNTSGSITSTVSVNATAGFSVVTYTGTGANATVGHGLGVAPSMIIVKCRSTAGKNWPVYHISNGTPQNNVVYLNLTNATNSSAGQWNSTAPTSTVFSVSGSPTSGYDDVNLSSGTYVAYCFAAVAGYSAFGKYTGNGSADGPFVYCGFRPRFVLIKESSAAGNNWQILDTSRDTYNVAPDILQPNLSNAESAFGSGGVDFLSNGFKIRTSSVSINTNGSTIIYAAFAENPFKNALAR